MSAQIRPTERASAYVLSMDGHDQSHVDLADPGRLEFDYVRRIGDVLDSWGAPAAPVRVLHLGGAALTLPRYVAHTRPRSAQVVLEPDAEVTELVRRELPLPKRSGIKVRPVDGRSGLAGCRPGSFDVVVVDAFADGRVPADLVTTDCAAEYARVLADDGLLVLNLVDGAPFAWTRRVVAAVRTALSALMLSAEPATLRARRPGNLLLVAGRSVVPVLALRARAASSPSPYRVLDGTQVSDTVGGGAPFVDADTEPSPPAQSGRRVPWLPR
ncbi:spermidine synthase [Nocardioides halotolerans]|uniref:spermidine synthase n=1 Tax=Nocardioides halotolerans TaxID=433660 RepID=UPI000426B9E0|nr:fused MFS/spermidine synthase [Nocardioides halotolerans]